MDETKTTDFGFKEVPVGEKVGLVGEVFDSVADKYDLMNDLMSMGIHRVWKRIAIALSSVRNGDHVLDLAGGTGDLTCLYHRRIGENGDVVLTDINASMLAKGRDRLVDSGIVSNIRYAQVNAESLPFAANSFDCVSIAFGLRNVTDKDAALASSFGVLKPGGRIIILEFSQPKGKIFRKAYDVYSFKLLPLLGKIITNDAESYRYLAESIRKHPDQEKLKTMMETAGFERCEYFNLTRGIVAIHRGYKL